MPKWQNAMRRFIVTLLALATIAPPTIVSAQSLFPLKISGDDRKLILLSDGSVRLSNPRTRKQPPSTSLVPLLGKSIDIAALPGTHYAVLEDGAVYAWGSNSNGALGLGSQTAPTAPTPIRVPGLPAIAKITAGRSTVLALTRQGTVYAWGSRESGMIGDGLHPKRYGESGQPALSPVLVPKVANIVDLAASKDHVLALSNDGRVLAWGSNFCGALGRAPRREIPIDEPGEVPNFSSVTAIAAGNGVSMALKQDGSVWVWGANWQGQFGNGERTDPPGVNNGWQLIPQQVKGIANATAISLGYAGRHTLVLLKDGTLRGWGNTDWGQLGGGLSATFQERPMTPKLTNVKAVFAVGNNSFAVRNDNSIWAWGSGGAEDWPFAANVSTPTPITIN
jgi:alpha-tubulin suppressor-like RCC1 family protein